MEFVLTMVTRFILDAFNKTKESWQANSILTSQLEFSELLPLMILMEVPKEQKNEAKIKLYKKVIEVEEQPSTRIWKGCSR